MYKYIIYNSVSASVLTRSQWDTWQQKALQRLLSKDIWVLLLLLFLCVCVCVS